MNASRNSAICSSVLGQANISKSHQALNPFATLLWSMSRPQTQLNTLSPVQLICHAPITKASSNYTGMSMWMPFLWHLSHKWVCSKSGGTCATLQVMLPAGNPCLCFLLPPCPPPKHCPAFLFTSAFYQQIHSKSLLPDSPQGEPGLIGLFGSKLKNNFNNKQSTHTILWSEHKKKTAQIYRYSIE